jgi:hypothetical protein
LASDEGVTSTLPLVRNISSSSFFIDSFCI